MITNADDFGFTRDVNSGIAEAHRNGVLTATTLMANGAAFDDAVRIAHETPSLDVGCHLVLIQGESLVDGGPFPTHLSDVVLQVMSGRLQPYRELRVQIEKIVAAGIRPTHLDTHKHTHVLPQVYRAVTRLAEEFGIRYVRLPIPANNRFVRGLYGLVAGRSMVRTTDHFAGFGLTGTLRVDTFNEALRHLPDGLTEFMCHPGYLGSELAGAATRLKGSRPLELEALVARQTRETLAECGIELTNYRDLR